MRAVVLAAGVGSRLRPCMPDLPKPLVPLAGRPLIAHAIETLASAGVTDATIVVGHRGELVRAALREENKPGLRLHFATNVAYAEGNAGSLYAVRHRVEPPFVLAMADHVAEPSLVRMLIAGAGDRCRLAVERVEAGDPRAGEATLALVRDGRVSALDKVLPEWNALDTGFFWCTSSVFDALTPERRRGELSLVFSALAAAGDLDAVDVTGSRWLDIDTEEDLRRAEALFPSHAGPA